jgi:hypothetical protein
MSKKDTCQKEVKQCFKYCHKKCSQQLNRAQITVKGKAIQKFSLHHIPFNDDHNFV